MTQRILVCDDEPQILRALRVILRDAGFEVDPAATAAEALDKAAVRPPHAAIIDLVLPDGDGIEVCRQLREWSAMPIIVLSAVGEEEQKVRALEAGADDYVTKPFGARELVARLQAALRRAAPAPDEPVLRADGLEIDVAAHRVHRDGEEVHLTPIEFELLSVLARNRGRLMTHRALLSEVWGPAYADDTATLRTHIANLRRKIEPPGGERRYIRTDAGVGYRFASLEPAGALEDAVQRDADREHDEQDCRVAVLPPELGHVLEVHAVEAEDHRRHRGDRDPARDLAQVLVVAHRQLREVRLQHAGQQLVEGRDLLDVADEVVVDVAEVVGGARVERQAGLLGGQALHRARPAARPRA